jgi:hypothetical protein
MQQITIMPMTPSLPRQVRDLSPAIAALTPIDRMTDRQLDREWSLCNREIELAVFWGDEVEGAQNRRNQVEQEQFRRRLARYRSDGIFVRPIAYDCPDPRRGISGPVITGSGKARRERKPSRFFLVVIAVLLFAGLAFASALAGQQLLALDARYASEVV